MKGQVFLGGACGQTTWRRDIAIPALEAAGVTYFNPQLGIGEWTPACEAAEMKAKNEADVHLFVINDQTRGVASVAEVAYLIAAGRPLALVLNDLTEDSRIDGEIVNKVERDDLNRGRIFIRTMAAEHSVPVFAEVEPAVQHAIELVNAARPRLSLSDLLSIIADVSFKQYVFAIQPVEDGFYLQLRCEEPDVNNGQSCLQEGRKWHLSHNASKSEVVQTAFKAVVTWQEHDAREHFRYQGEQVFSPHSDVDRLLQLRPSHEKKS